MPTEKKRFVNRPSASGRGPHRTVPGRPQRPAGNTLPFDFLKKKGAAGDKKKAPDDAGGKSSAKKGLGLMEFGQAVKSLVPVENKKNAEAKKDKRSLGVKIEDDTGLGKTLRTKGWMERRWQEVDAEMKKQGIEGMVKNYRDPFFAYLESEWSLENGVALEALDAGMSMEDFYARFLDASAQEEINVPKQLEIRQLAAQGRFGEIDRSSIRKNLITNLSDTFSRAQFNQDLRNVVFERLTDTRP